MADSQQSPCLKLIVELDGAKALLDQEKHLQHSGLFFSAPDPLPTPLMEFLLHVCTPFGEAQLLAKAVHVMPGGVSVVFCDKEACTQTLMPLLQHAHGLDAAQGQGEVRVRWDIEERKTNADGTPDNSTCNPAQHEKEEGTQTLFDQIRGMSTPERMQLAKHGNQAERRILMKDPNKNVHTFLIQNTKISLDEVRSLSENRQINPQVLDMIAKNREWTQNPRIVHALVCNPKTPTPTAIRMLDKLPPNELRRIGRSNDIRRPVSLAARKKMNEP